MFLSRERRSEHGHNSKQDDDFRQFGGRCVEMASSSRRRMIGASRRKATADVLRFLALMNSAFKAESIFLRSF